ncbi:MAG: sulfite exporter TauE/SafE family protein [Deltaproteobacteria bacterium]|nr:sulfite exporter TauE/SafE family protein [Deltaproteobacteria bacterium]MBW2413442.1 sulfite exporter TauE/SafE family protein [Deltaproteobacteria bacterium]
MAVLVAGGAVAGFVNTLAGGGSFLTVPLLIFLGLPPTVANATNRVGVAAQSLAAMGGFRQENVPGLRFAASLLPATLLGSWLGAWAASSVSDRVFSVGFAVVMLAMLPVILRNPKPRAPGERAGMGLPLQLGVYFAIGLYGGAVQAGIGIPLLLALVAAGGLDLVRANAVKVAVVAALTLVALAQFAAAGKVLWGYGLVLAVGSAIGGYAASRFGARVGDRLIRPLLTLAVVAAALRLLSLSF